MPIQQQLLGLGDLFNFSDLSAFTQNIPVEWGASALLVELNCRLTELGGAAKNLTSAVGIVAESLEPHRRCTARHQRCQDESRYYGDSHCA